MFKLSSRHEVEFKARSRIFLDECRYLLGTSVNFSVETGTQCAVQGSGASPSYSTRNKHTRYACMFLPYCTDTSSSVEERSSRRACARRSKLKIWLRSAVRRRQNEHSSVTTRIAEYAVGCYEIRVRYGSRHRCAVAGRTVGTAGKLIIMSSEDVRGCRSRDVA